MKTLIEMCFLFIIVYNSKQGSRRTHAMFGQLLAFIYTNYKYICRSGERQEGVKRHLYQNLRTVRKKASRNILKHRITKASLFVILFVLCWNRKNTVNRLRKNFFKSALSIFHICSIRYSCRVKCIRIQTDTEAI